METEHAGRRFERIQHGRADYVARTFIAERRAGESVYRRGAASLPQFGIPQSAARDGQRGSRWIFDRRRVTRRDSGDGSGSVAASVHHRRDCAAQSTAYGFTAAAEIVGAREWIERRFCRDGGPNSPRRIAVAAAKRESQRLGMALRRHLFS